MNNRLNSEFISMTVKEFTDIKIDEQIKLEESFQRGTQTKYHLGMTITKKIISTLHL